MRFLWLERGGHHDPTTKTRDGGCESVGFFVNL